MAQTVDHSMDHVEHPASYDESTGQYSHPQSLSDHMGADIAALKDKMSEGAHKAVRVVKNLVGEGEREDLFQK